MPKSQATIYILLIIYGVAVATAYHFWQPPNKYAENPLADANEYLKIVEYFKFDQASYSVRHSIHQRVAIPWLAAQLPFEKPETAFFLINSFFAIITLPLMFYFMSYLQVKKEYVLVVILYFSVHWVGPFRQNAIDPVNVDMPVYIFEMLLVLFMLKRKYIWLLLIAPLVIAVKEVALAYLIVNFLVVVGIRIFLRNKSMSVSWAFIVLVAGIATSLILNWQFPSPRPDITPLHVMAFHLREALLHPDHFIRWALGVFAAFGTFLFLPRPGFRALLKAKEPDTMLFSFALSALALSFLGGMDYTRLAFIAFPLVMSAIMRHGQQSRLTFIGAFILSMIMTRFWISLPVIGLDLSPYNSWMPEYASAPWLIAWAITALACFGLMGYLHNRQKRAAKENPFGK